jgi:uncharacterized membrane protein
MNCEYKLFAFIFQILQHLLEIQDVATVTWPEGKKKPKTVQVQGVCGGAWYGAFWGML